jgi:multidrug transporter EmrE-like cation transporter
MMSPSSANSRLSLALLWTVLVAADSAAQLLFKSAAVHLAQPAPTFAWVAMVAQSWRVWSAVACLLLTFGCWMLVLRRASLSRAFPVTALTFVGVIGGSWWFFGETIVPMQYAGIALIIAGVALLKPLDA